MKRLTIASLQNQNTDLQARVAKLLTHSEEQRRTITALEQKAEELESQIKRQDRKHGDDMACVERQRFDAQETLYRHRSAVLVYFMAAGNPETAKDTARLALLQHDITGTIPPPINPESPRNIGCMSPHRY